MLFGHPFAHLQRGAYQLPANFARMGKPLSTINIGEKDANRLLVEASFARLGLDDYMESLFISIFS